MQSFKLFSGLAFLLVSMIPEVQGRQLKFRVQGTSFGDNSFCFPAVYTNKEGDEEFGTLTDCVTDGPEFFDGGIIQFQLTSTYSPYNENYELVTQCIVTVTPDDSLEGDFNAREECYNENGVIAGGNGSVTLLGVVDISKLFITGELTVDVFWTIEVD